MDSKVYSGNLDFDKYKQNISTISKQKSIKFQDIEKNQNIRKINSVFTMKIKRILSTDLIKNDINDESFIWEYLLKTLVSVINLIDNNFEELFEKFKEKEIFRNFINKEESNLFFQIDIDIEYLKNLIIIEKSVIYNLNERNDIPINISDIDQNIVFIWLSSNILNTEVYVPFIYIYNVIFFLAKLIPSFLQNLNLSIFLF